MPKGTRNPSGVILVGSPFGPTTAFRTKGKADEVSLSGARGIVGDARLKRGLDVVKMKQRGSKPDAGWGSTVVYSNSSKKATPKRKGK